MFLSHVILPFHPVWLFAELFNYSPWYEFPYDATIDICRYGLWYNNGKPISLIKVTQVRFGSLKKNGYL